MGNLLLVFLFPSALLRELWEYEIAPALVFAYPSPNPQYLIPFKPGELSLHHPMTLFRRIKQSHELRSVPNLLKPRITQHGGITKETAADHALKKFERGINLV